jgi:hypothetical protein
MQFTTPEKSAGSGVVFREWCNGLKLWNIFGEGAFLPQNKHHILF